MFSLIHFLSVRFYFVSVVHMHPHMDGNHRCLLYLRLVAERAEQWGCVRIRRSAAVLRWHFEISLGKRCDPQTLAWQKPHWRGPETHPETLHGRRCPPRHRRPHPCTGASSKQFNFILISFWKQDVKPCQDLTRLVFFGGFLTDADFSTIIQKCFCSCLLVKLLHENNILCWTTSTLLHCAENDCSQPQKLPQANTLNPCFISCLAWLIGEGEISARWLSGKFQCCCVFPLVIEWFISAIQFISGLFI